LWIEPGILQGGAQKMKVSGFVAGLLTAGCFVMAAGQVRADDKSLNAMDKSFAMKAAQGGMAEVKLGELAVNHGSSEKVKQFGQRMIDDHGKANTEFKEIATKKGMTLPSSLDAKTKALYNRLEGLHGAAFDSAYIKAMKEDHAKDIAEFKREAANGHDSDIKGFASKTLPVVQEHYKMLQDWNGKMSGH